MRQRKTGQHLRTWYDLTNHWLILWITEFCAPDWESSLKTLISQIKIARATKNVFWICHSGWEWGITQTHLQEHVSLCGDASLTDAIIALPDAGCSSGQDHSTSSAAMFVFLFLRCFCRLSCFSLLAKCHDWELHPAAVGWTRKQKKNQQPQINNYTALL